LKILIFGSQQVMGMARQFFGNKPLLARGKNDGHELYRATLSVVKLKRHQHPGRKRRYVHTLGSDAYQAIEAVEHGSNLEKAIQKLKRVRGNLSEELLTHLSALGWEHINLTGDYVWRQMVASGTAASGLYASNLNGSLLSVQYRTNRQVTPQC
jgi:Tn3 transposase DDE domain